MVAISQDIIITTQLDEATVRDCSDPIYLRLAYEWLCIEKEMKGQGWFAKKYLDKGLVKVKVDERYCKYVYEAVFTLTLDDTRPTELKNVRVWELFNSQNTPFYVRVLKGERKLEDFRNKDIPHIIEELWKEIQAA